ncbi:restriction endonuclease subunit S [Streptomyces pseudogriseolus]|uniref:restriction endonuclease subunit S n=1 Tax=Streptomyces pseudogriseolus TaxID=36817 RepID=UPI003FA20625
MRDNRLPYGSALPGTWTAVPLKHLATLTNGYVFNSGERSDTGTPIIRIENLNGSSHFNHSQLNLPNKYRVDSGDLLFSWSGNPGTSFGPYLWTKHGKHYLNQHIFKVGVFGCDPRWLYWALMAATHWIERELTSGMIGMVHVTKEDLSSVPIPVPPVELQRRIADFLDAETIRMDRIDMLDQRLVALLKERRQAAIDHAVTASSPAVTKLFWRLALLRDGTHQPPPRVNTGVPLLTARNVSSGTLRLTDVDTHVSEEDADILERSLRLQEGDVLLSVKGTIGACAVTPPGFPRAVLDRNVAVLRPAAGHSSEWLATVLISTALQEQMRLAVTAAAQPGLPLGVIRELRIPDVHPELQAALAEKVRSECESVDRAIQHTARKSALLAERRQALITAAVTGQFDVTTASGRNVTEGVSA